MSLTPPAILTRVRQLAARRDAFLTTLIRTHRPLAKTRGTLRDNAVVRFHLARQTSGGLP